MRITINLRRKLFVKRPGVPMLLPGTAIAVTPYLTHFALSNGQHIATGFKGPARTFFACQDLERACITVWGEGATGYFRRDLYPTPDRTSLIVAHKRPKEAVWSPPSCERLSLGCHKQQDWDLVMRRFALTELLPFWARLGQLTPAHSLAEGASLLSELHKAISQRARDDVVPLLDALVRTGFDGVFVPQAVDRLSWGYPLPPVAEGTSSLALLSVGSGLIRSLFIQENQEQIRLLPLVPRQFVSGRLTDAHCRLGTVDLEWSKRTLRRVVMRAQQEGVVVLDLGHQIKGFRMRRHRADRGERLDATARFAVSTGEVLWLDRFESV